MASFSKYCSNTNADKISKLRELVEDPNTVFLGASNGKVIILHSPTNFCGTRTRKTNKVACLTGMGTEATCILLNVESILSIKKFKGAEKDDAFKCNSTEEIRELNKDKFHNLGAMFIPALFLRIAI